MRFCSVLLIINDELPDKSLFERLISVGDRHYRKGRYLYSVECDFYNEDYFWMYFQYDNENLYTDTVVDTTDNSTKNNPRPKNQVELRYQLFACYSIRHQTLYISNYDKKSVISDYIKDMLQVSVVIKNVIKSVDEYFEAIKYLKSVSFTQRRLISNFSKDKDSIFQREASLYGLDTPERSKVRFDYGISPISLSKTVLQDWKSKHSKREFEEVIVVGIDDSGIENTFDFSTMIAHIEIDSHRDENDRHDPDNVRRLLFGKLGISGD